MLLVQGTIPPLHRLNRSYFKKKGILVHAFLFQGERILQDQYTPEGNKNEIQYTLCKGRRRGNKCLKLFTTKNKDENIMYVRISGVECEARTSVEQQVFRFHLYPACQIENFGRGCVPLNLDLEKLS